jgi:hypothetical protein
VHGCSLPGYGTPIKRTCRPGNRHPPPRQP